MGKGRMRKGGGGRRKNEIEGGGRLRNMLRERK